MAQFVGENTTAQLNGLFKQRYASELKKLVSDVAKLNKRIKFSEADRLGDKYNQPVELSLEHGFTYATAGAGAFPLNAAVAGQMKNAVVDGYQLLLRGAMDYESAAKAAAGGAQAFDKATGRLVARMVDALSKRLEIMHLYGQTGIGTVKTTTAGSTTFVVADAQWASGIWAGMEGAVINIKQGVTGTDRVAAVAITSVDFDTHTVTLASAQTLTAGDTIYLQTSAQGGSYGNEFAGLDKIITNTGVLFGIDAATYSLWRGNVYDAASGALTLAKINSAVGKAVGKGLQESASCFISPATWASLSTDQASMRKFDAKYSPSNGDNGFEKLTFYSQNGELSVEPHTCVKEGEAFILPLGHVKKVGATDVTFNLPGRGDEFFRQLDGNAGYELRAYANLALFVDAPGLCVKIKNIVNP